ncbi:hypothetical protein BRC2024_AWKCSVWU_CDS_0002 [Acinetobacter phage vB_AbaP_ABW132]
MRIRRNLMLEWWNALEGATNATVYSCNSVPN